MDLLARTTYHRYIMSVQDVEDEIHSVLYGPMGG